MTSSGTKATNFLYALLFGSCCFFISLMVHLNPSGAGVPTPFGNTSSALAFGILSFAVCSALFMPALFWKKKRYFLMVFFISFSVHFVMLIVFSFVLHGDYLTMVFQLFVMYPIIYLRVRRRLSRGPVERFYIKNIILISIILFSLCLLWVLLMGYTIITGLEPRGTEGVCYNVYFALLLFLLFIEIVKLNLRLYRKVYLEENRIRIDKYDFTEYLGDINLLIVREFLDKHQINLTCSDLQSIIANKNDKKDADRTNCEECLTNKHKVTLCTKYRNIYTRIWNIKKLFESLEIGTILSPENKMNILTVGWKLRLFDDVKIVRK